MKRREMQRRIAGTVKLGNVALVGLLLTVCGCESGSSDRSSDSRGAAHSIGSGNSIGSGGRGDGSIDDTALSGSGGSGAHFGTCLDLLASDRSLADGVYVLDLDSDGPFPARSFYCDMANGGWTLVANQVPAAPLPNLTTTVNAEGFGALDQSYRLGNPDITSIRPIRGWKLTDNTTTVYFRPACVVDWTINYIDNTSPTDCTTGYTSANFAAQINAIWASCSARGIGINNNGSFCSIRMYEAQFNTAGVPQGGVSAGAAAPCDYNDTSQRVSLWFQ